MIQKFKAEFTADDRAVSPVIGVILMVAITVILAAVIASLTLGLGDSAQTAPQAKFDFDQKTQQFTDAGGDTVSLSTVDVSFEAGQNLDEERISVVVEDSEALTASDSSDEANLVWSNSGTIGAGNSITVAASNASSSAVTYPVTALDYASGSDSIDTSSVAELSSGQTIKVIWTSEDGGTSTTLAEYTVE